MGGAVLCSQCGAPLPEGAAHRASTCPFCGATNAPPPDVVERVVEKIVVEKAVVAAPDALACPRCAGPLHEVRTRTTRLRGCERCGGVWLDHETVQRLSERHDEDVEDAARRMALVRAPMAPEVRQAVIACPECRAELRKVPIPDTIFVVDVCSMHGTWFDYDEVRVFADTFYQRRVAGPETDDVEPTPLERGFFSDLYDSIRMLIR